MHIKVAKTNQMFIVFNSQLFKNRVFRNKIGRGQTLKIEAIYCGWFLPTKTYFWGLNFLLDFIFATFDQFQPRPKDQIVSSQKFNK
jgi:hypothetical protein